MSLQPTGCFGYCENFRREQSGEILLQVVTHSKKCSVYFIDKDSAEARWVGLGEQSVKHSSRVLQLLKFLFVILAPFFDARFGPIPPNLCRSLHAFPLVLGWESSTGHRGSRHVTGGQRPSLAVRHD